MFKWMCRERLISVAMFTLLTVMVTAGPAAGGDFVTSITVREEYNDNIFFTAGNETGDFITTISPGAAFQEQNERLDAAASVRLDGLYYWDNNQLNGVDQTYAGHWRIRLTPRFSFGIEGSYSIDTRSDRDVQETGIVLSTSRRTRKEAAATTDYAISEKAAINVGASFRDDAFEDEPSSDYCVYTANLLWTYNLSTYLPRTIARALFGHTRAEYVSARVYNYSMMIGFSRQITELWTLTADAGLRFTVSNFDVLAIDNQQYGGVGQIELVYQDETNRFSLLFSHDVTAASGLAGSTERTGLRARYRRHISERMWANLSTSYYLNRSEQGEFAVDAIDEETFNLRAMLSYYFTEDVALESGYTFSLNKDNEAGLEYTRNLIYLQIFLQHAYLKD